MKCKFPVKGITYKFDAVDPNTHRDSAWSGLCKKFEKEIFIDKSLPLEQAIVTLLHEWGHALLHEVSVDDTLTSEVEEIIVDNYAKELFSVFFRDNKFSKLLKKMVIASIKNDKKSKKKGKK